MDTQSNAATQTSDKTITQTKSEALKEDLLAKEEVLYAELVDLQINIYKSRLGNKQNTDDKRFYLNKMMQLRQICNHPYLLQGVEEQQGVSELETHLIQNSGKMIILDKLLAKLAQEQRKVVLFCQMTRMLDILEDYCHLKKYQYCRIDGNVSADMRSKELLEFNKTGSEKFVFLMTPRNLNIGMNFSAADTIILYDSDTSHQIEQQGIQLVQHSEQKDKFNVYRLLTKNSVEEKVFEYQKEKLGQETQGYFYEEVTIDKLNDIIEFGADVILSSSSSTEKSTLEE